MLEIRNVTKVFNRGTIDERTVLNNLSLTINDGEFVTLIGGNGAGKSTLQNIISGTYKPDEGQVLIDGVDVTNLPEYKRAKYLGRVFQDPRMGTASDMQIEENLAIAYYRGQKHTLMPGINNKLRKIFAETLSELGLGLENRMSSKMKTLSGGQRQTVTLLMATLTNPKLLLLDEHTAALDPKTAKKVMEITDRIVTENKLSTLMITHNMKDAINYGDRLIMLNAGQLILDISGEDKKNLTVPKLLEYFSAASGTEFANDNAVLS